MDRAQKRDEEELKVAGILIMSLKHKTIVPEMKSTNKEQFLGRQVESSEVEINAWTRKVMG